MSLLGSQVTLIALPLTAILTLHASADQMGLLRVALTAPFPLFADSASFVLLAAILRTIRDPEPQPAPAEQPSLLREIREGLVALLGHPMLRSITITTTLVNLTISLLTPILILYLVQT